MALVIESFVYHYGGGESWGEELWDIDRWENDGGRTESN